MTSMELLEMAIESLDIFNKRSKGHGFPLSLSRSLTKAQCILIKEMLVINAESKTKDLAHSKVDENILAIKDCNSLLEELDMSQDSTICTGGEIKSTSNISELSRR